MKADARKAEERRCIVTGEVGPKEGLIRFVIGPEGTPVPDLGERLPGRGIWVSARREALETAIRKGLFSKAAREKVEVPEGLADDVEALLTKRAAGALGLARKAGALVLGFEKVLTAIGKGEVALLIEARDGSEDGSRKLEAALRTRNSGAGKADVPVLRPLFVAEMGLALGRANVVHAALTKGSMEEKVMADLARLESYGRQMRPVGS
ncbi:RNA-binding protein [Parvibaculum sp.]|uniref:RNA-binding protein n=1 Tax=Parvibaculum sp. TaxID=2024848 RepID=UPI002CA6F799|nr:RNA-binding protein [Parvibaculum sp.]HUD51524.1 RNA-binding protein [Parvibaculum sp.]